MKYSTLALSFIISSYSLFAQDLEVQRVPIGTKSMPETSEVKLSLIARIQSYNSHVKNNNDIYDKLPLHFFPSTFLVTGKNCRLQW